MFTTIAVSTATGALNANATQQLPPAIESIWAADLAQVALEDISLNHFGAQRHTFASYSLLYRLDVQPNMLRRVAFEHKHKYGTKTPTILEVLSTAKIWLTFDTEVRFVFSLAETARSDTCVIFQLFASRSPARNNVAVVYNQATPKDAHVPALIEQKWRSDLVYLVHDDLLQGLNGARRHNPSTEYAIMYRLDISDKAFQAASQCLNGHGNKEAPSFEEILASAKIWLSFNEPTLNPVVSSVNESSDLNAITVPASPALSTVSVDTLVGEDHEVDLIGMKVKLLEEDMQKENFNSEICTPVPGIIVGCLERVFGPIHPNGPPRRRHSNKKDHKTVISEVLAVPDLFQEHQGLQSSR